METTKIQKIREGYGPRYHRLYRVSFPCEMRKELHRTMCLLQKDMNSFSPQLLAKFEKEKGDPNKLQVGDEFTIRITGPWNGPVRVTAVSENSFKLATLEGHLEAGEIIFSVREADGKALFEIESIARSRDRIVDLLYDKIAIAKFAQTEMWDYFCNSFAEQVLGGKDKIEKVCGKVEMFTERFNEESQAWETI